MIFYLLLHYFHYVLKKELDTGKLIYSGPSFLPNAVSDYIDSKYPNPINFSYELYLFVHSFKVLWPCFKGVDRGNLRGGEFPDFKKYGGVLQRVKGLGRGLGHRPPHHPLATSLPCFMCALKEPLKLSNLKAERPVRVVLWNRICCTTCLWLVIEYQAQKSPPSLRQCLW